MTAFVPPTNDAAGDLARRVWHALVAGAPRTPGSRASATARALLRDVLGPVLPSHQVREEVVLVPRWRSEGGHRVEGADGVVLHGETFMGSPATPAEGVRGRLRLLGEYRVWGYRPWRRWALWDDSARSVVGYIVERLDGPAIPQANPDGSTAQPRLAVGKEAHRRLSEWARQRALVTLYVGVETGEAPTAAANLVLWPPEAPTVLVGGHLDSVYTTAGAYDNAAGVATLVAAAAAMAETDVARHTAFAFFDGEESGLWGSRAFCREHADALAGLAFVNLDGVGRGQLLEAWIFPEGLDDLVLAVLDGQSGFHRYEVKFPPPPASDHMAFVAHGVWSVMWTVDDQEIIHTAADVRDPRVEANMARMVPVVVDAVRRLHARGQGGGAAPHRV